MKILELTQFEKEKEFLNIITYTEMKRRGMSDSKIVFYYDIRPFELVKFKRKNGFIRKRGRHIGETDETYQHGRIG